MSGIRITGLGKALPDRIVTNDDMSRIVDTSDEWIRTRTGIRERRIAGQNLPEILRTEQGPCDKDKPDETCTGLAARAAREALQDAGASPSDIGLVVAATMSPDFFSPSVACSVQEALGLPPGIPAFDVNAACSGFVYAMTVANAMMQQMHIGCALVIGADAVTSLIDFTDRGTCVLFGDGAGAAVVRRDEGCSFAGVLGAEGKRSALSIPVGGHMLMDGRDVFRFAVTAVPKVLAELEQKTGISCRDIDQIVLHQANDRIIEHIRRKLALPEEKFFRNLQHYGNTCAASIPVALTEMKEQGLLSPGTRIFCVGFGAGLAWGGLYLEFQ
ncbi:MAG: ketoacyl-ACP synthase III [Lachnospiraceae bacterium]|jgi:3-oxoacyl-[acyl-carrier-protein] synthase-3|nr:ketoacyl-ACP synthase III [Lachnospiraceae bacterium]MCH4064869.1 ketoacyl-ACP synthase III [Lachnospiraceae bacterium]MCH4103845.1 ketoacyl-ACP synthase III [Lachnospiraceae bacterium]MCI1308171.1 ketoacyl-ACP synthase III [Lachnospiraceae bacterium]MCI1333038.1 ketoacyl-ACP synthase III [Lachnospiraceae bacterium]